jgi:hypothetical protein
MIYLVFIEAKEDLVKGVAWEFVKALMGPIIHVELVVMNDRVLDSLHVNIPDCPGGYPIFERNKQFEELKDGQYHWVKIPTDHAKEAKTKALIEKILEERTYQMSVEEMLGSVIPEEFHSWFPWIFKRAFTSKYEAPTRTGQPVYCTSLCTKVLKEGYGMTDLPEKCTASELLYILTKVKKFEVKPTTPFRSYRPPPVRDGANIKRAARSLYAMLDLEEELV